MENTENNVIEQDPTLDSIRTLALIYNQYNVDKANAFSMLGLIPLIMPHINLLAFEQAIVELQREGIVA